MIKCCPICNRDFVPSGPRPSQAVYCSAACRNRKNNGFTAPPPPRLCPGCGVEFAPTNDRARFHSRECQESYNVVAQAHRRGRKRVGSEVDCRFCGEPFVKTKGRQAHCSQRCAQRYARLAGYGLTLEEFRRLYQEFEGHCHNPGCRRGMTLFNAEIDHEHGTGRVRGLLCGLCNRLLGFARDDKQILAGAVEYLDRQTMR